MFACIQVALLRRRWASLRTKCAERPPTAEELGNTLVPLPFLCFFKLLSCLNNCWTWKIRDNLFLHHLSCGQGRNKDEVCRAGLKSLLSNSLQWWRPTYFSVWREEGWGGRVRGINRTWSQRCHLYSRVQDFLLGDSCAGGNRLTYRFMFGAGTAAAAGGMAQNQTPEISMVSSRGLLGKDREKGKSEIGRNKWQASEAKGKKKSLRTYPWELTASPSTLLCPDPVFPASQGPSGSSTDYIQDKHQPTSEVAPAEGDW